jgi:hypothetical protein
MGRPKKQATKKAGPKPKTKVKFPALKALISGKR